MLRSDSAHQSGFTLVEVLVASVLAVMIAGLMINLIGGTGTMQQRNSAQLSVDDSLRASLELMSMDLREATVTRVLSNAAGRPAPSRPG